MIVATHEKTYFYEHGCKIRVRRTLNETKFTITDRYMCDVTTEVYQERLDRNQIRIKLFLMAKNRGFKRMKE